MFAHTPPPMHGQSFMVKLLLDGLGGDQRKAGARGVAQGGVGCYHVNARLSRGLEDVGTIRFSKLFLLVFHCLQAIWCRFRYGANTLYYVPAPGKRGPLWRDWLVMAMCRPFFSRVILHWHATSMAKWLETSTPMTVRILTYRYMGRADLSIVLSEHDRFCAEKLWPRRIEVVPNGVPDPCPDFAATALPEREARLVARKRLLEGKALTEEDVARSGGDPQVVHVLFLAHCTAEKGLFDAVSGVLRANEELRAKGAALTFRLLVAGVFQDPAERREFERLCGTGPAAEAVKYAGFLQGDEKTKAMRKADLLCFPSHWESFGVVLVEAMAFGLPAVTTKGGAPSEVMPPNYPGLAKVGNPEEIAAALLKLVTYGDFTGLREHFLRRYTFERFISCFGGVLQSVEERHRDEMLRKRPLFR
jgi:glycosyltransferase involved in cell wall biosynthesis